jgi:hypothetical protein
MYRIHWISRKTILTGYGEFCLDYYEAMEWKEFLDEMYPDILHTVESNLDAQSPLPDQASLPNLPS